MFIRLIFVRHFSFLTVVHTHTQSTVTKMRIYIAGGGTGRKGFKQSKNGQNSKFQIFSLLQAINLIRK